MPVTRGLVVKQSLPQPRSAASGRLLEGLVEVVHTMALPDSAQLGDEGSHLLHCIGLSPDYGRKRGR